LGDIASIKLYVAISWCHWCYWWDWCE